jgi:membrane protease YdiL (CAAX protease family)
LVALTAVWLAVGRVLPEVLLRALPRTLLDSLSLPAYNMLCQVATTVVGIGISRLLLERPAEALGITRPSGRYLALAAMLAPILFVAASFVAIKIAEPYLMAELAREGAGASRRNAGAFGKAVTEAPLVVTLVWGAVLAAIAEELPFRGALFGAVEESAVAMFGARRKVAGIAAAVVAGVAFGAMHADMQGSVGIVRVVSTTCLGLACGGARLVAGTVFVPMVVHFVYNAVSLALGRGLFRGDSEPLVSVVPNRLLAFAAALALGGLALIAVRRARRVTSIE